MEYQVIVQSEKRQLTARNGENLLELLRGEGLFLQAPCGGNGRCGKCAVLVDGEQQLACQTNVDRDMVVMLPPEENSTLLSAGVYVELDANSGLCLAVDIGTTTVAAYLTEHGKLLFSESRKNPQAVFGADVVSRIQWAIKNDGPKLTAAIRSCVSEMTDALLQKSEKRQLERVCVVGNPAMQQLFLGLGVENLARIPFAPALKTTRIEDGGKYIPAWSGAQLLTVPDIAGYLGGDTMACILATGMDKMEPLTLLVDIGTNGEMVLGNKNGFVACATAAGPALEGAGIRFGMQATEGAIDRVSVDFSCHVIGNTKASGICGSGLLDAVAVALEKGLINERGRILNEAHCLPLADGVYLTQEDIRQFQQAKGAIAAGVEQMAAHLGVSLENIERVYLAGAFGTYMDPKSACRTGLLPAVLEERIQPVGNAAGSGAMRMACSQDAFGRADSIVATVTHLDLATLPDWGKCFARNMRFMQEPSYWCEKARALGFSNAVPVNTGILTAREDVRAMCASDKCRAYGKNWTCPPHCGTLEKCESRMRCYRRGILLQTVGITKKIIDSKAYRETEKRHLRQLYTLAEEIRNRHPEALCLGSGGCRICQSCAYPEPCRFPEKSCASMEAYGLMVSDVCRDNGLAYHHGEMTVTYTACILF